MSDIGDPTWNENDASNTSASPGGWPEGMLPSGVNDSARMMMGATKRFWDRINGTVTTSDVLNAYNLIYAINESSLYNGSIYTFRCGSANTGPATLNVGIGGTKPLVKMGQSTSVPLEAGDLYTGGYYQAVYDALTGQFIVMGTIPSNAINVLQSISACISSELTSLSLNVQTDLRSVSALLETHINAVSNSISMQIASVSARMNNAIAGSMGLRRLPVAWGSFTGDTPSLSHFLGFNFLSVTRSGPGAYIIRFATPLDTSAGLAVTATAKAAKAFLKTTGVDSEATLSSSYIVITTIAASDATTHNDSAYVAFSVYGAGFAS